MCLSCSVKSATEALSLALHSVLRVFHSALKPGSVPSIFPWCEAIWAIQDCRPMCEMYSMKSIQARLHPSLFKAMRFLQYTKKLQRVQKVPVTRICQNTVYRWTVSSIRMGNNEPWNRRLKIGYFAHSQKYKKTLVHPNTHLYRFVLYLENQFKKYRDSTNILEEIL